MNEAEKTTVAVTLAVHEEILRGLLARALREAPQEEITALQARMDQGPLLNPDAPVAPDLDTADQIAGYGMEYHETINRIYRQALALSGRSAHPTTK